MARGMPLLCELLENCQQNVNELELVETSRTWCMFPGNRTMHAPHLCVLSRQQQHARKFFSRSLRVCEVVVTCQELSTIVESFFPIELCMGLTYVLLCYVNSLSATTYQGVFQLIFACVRGGCQELSTMQLLYVWNFRLFYQQESKQTTYILRLFQCHTQSYLVIILFLAAYKLSAYRNAYPTSKLGISHFNCLILLDMVGIHGPLLKMFDTLFS